MHRSGCRRGDGLGIRHLGNAEIRDLDLAVTGNNDILRLDITMNDPLLVCGAQSAGNLHGNIQCLADAELSLHLDIILEGDALNQFHYDKVDAVFVTYVIYTDNIRMGQSRRGLCLCPEFAHKIIIRAEFMFQDFDGHKTIESLVLRLVDIRHTARTDAFNNLVSVLQHTAWY